MAIASGGSLGVGAHSTSSASFTFTTATSTLAAGNFGLLTVVTDNLGTADGDNNEHVGVSGGAGTWSKIGEYTNANGAAAAGVTTSLWMFDATGSVPTGTTITVTLAGAVVDKTTSFWKFTKAAGYSIRLDPTASPNLVGNGVDATTGFGVASISGPASSTRLYFRALGKEANSTTALTVTAGYTSITANRSRNNSSAVLVRGEFRLTTTGETSSPTLSVTGDTAGLFAALIEVVPKELAGDTLLDANTAGDLAVTPLNIESKGVAYGTTSATLPAHATGDVIFAWAYRDTSATPPTVPGGWTMIQSGGSDGNSAVLAYKVAASGAEASGTWTNATACLFVVYSGQNAGSPVGISTQMGGSGSVVHYPDTIPNNNDSFLLAFAGHASTDVALATEPGGLKLRATAGIAGASVAAFSSGGASAGIFDGVGDFVYRSPGIAGMHRSVAYGNGIYVACVEGTSNTIDTSPDGVTWTSRTIRSGLTGAAKFVAFGAGVFVLHTDSQALLYSTDGINWSYVTGFSVGGYNSLIYGGGGFLTYLWGNSELSRSTNGSSWAAIGSAPSGAPYGSKVLWANDTFIAVGGSGYLSTSSDLSAWTNRSTGTSETLYAVAALSGLYVVGGSNGAILTSPDLVTWTARSSGFGASSVNAIIVVDGTLLAVGDGGKLATSPDGITWTFKAGAFGAFSIADICVGPLVVAAGGAIYTAPLPGVDVGGTAGDWRTAVVELRIPGSGASVSMTVDLAGALAVGKPLASSVAASAQLGGGIAVGKPLSASASATASASAGLAVSKRLTAGVAANASLVGSLAVAKPLGGAASLSASLDGTLFSALLHLLGGSLSASVSMSGGLSVSKRLAGDARMTATVGDVMTVAKMLGGAATATASASASLTTAKLLLGALTVNASASGAATRSVNLAGNLVATAQLSAALALHKPLAGALVAAGSVSAPLALAKPLGGALSVSLDVLAALAPLRWPRSPSTRIVVVQAEWRSMVVDPPQNVLVIPAENRRLVCPAQSN